MSDLPDQRSSWRVEKLSDPCDKCVGKGRLPVYAHGEFCTECDATYLIDGKWVCSDSSTPTDWRACDCLGGQTNHRLRAVAFTPGPESDGKIIATFEAETPGGLRMAIERSGLTTGIGSAMWLGSEIERVWRDGGGK